MIGEYSGNVFFYNCDATQVDELSSVRKDILNNSNNVIDKVICNVGNGSGSNKYLQDYEEWDKSWRQICSPISAKFLDDLKKSKGSFNIHSCP